jgi:hypothetical protein
MTDPILEAHWKAVLDDWDSDRPHGAFLEYCEKSDQLLEAAVRYRGMSGDRTRGPSADKRLTAISMLALAKLESARTLRRTPAFAFSRLVLIVFFIASVAALIAAWRR